MKVIPRLCVSYSNENKLGRQRVRHYSKTLPETTKNVSSATVKGPRTNQRPKRKNGRKNCILRLGALWPEKIAFCENAQTSWIIKIQWPDWAFNGTKHSGKTNQTCSRTSLTHFIQQLLHFRTRPHKHRTLSTRMQLDQRMRMNPTGAFRPIYFILLQLFLILPWDRLIQVTRLKIWANQYQDRSRNNILTCVGAKELCFGPEMDECCFYILLQWTFCVASSVAIGAAVWFYFITESTKQMVYASIVLLGFGNSGMIVMALSFVAHFIGNDKVSIT